MILQITVKDVNGKVIPGVEVKYRSPNSFLPIDTQTTNANGVVTIKNDTWTDGWYYTFKKSTEVCPFKLAYKDNHFLPMEYNVVLSPAILYFKLYKYNEDTKAEELYKQPIKVEPYRYTNGNMTAETAISSLSIENDGYYYIDLRNISSSSNHPIEYTSYYLFKITANNLTNYGSIFLLPNGFIKKEITNWESQPYTISITENTLPEQKMVFYPNTKRLTKAELRMCVVSNPHLMNDDENDTYCPTNITYSTIYNMIKDSNGRDENYISGVEDVNFYQDKTLTIQAPASLRQLSYCYIDCPGIIQFDGNKHTLFGNGGTCKIPVYYSSTVTVRAKTNGSDHTTAQHRIIMDGDKTLTLNIKLKTFTYVIEKISLLGLGSGSSFAWKRAKIVGRWKDETPSTVNDLSIAVTIYDPKAIGYLSFKDTFTKCTGTGTDKLAHRYMYDSIDHGQNTANDIVWENGKSFYVVSIFFSNTNIYYQFENNGYYYSGVFRPHVVPEPTNAPVNPGGGSSWGGGDYTVTVIPNGKSVECNLEDNRGNKKHETITSGKTYNVQRLTVSGFGYWKYSSDSDITDGPDADGYTIPTPKDPTGRKIKLELVQLW